MIHYGLYGQQHCISHDDLCGLNKETGGDYIARAENSGCEGFYTEVARWSHQQDRWEKFCFTKFLGGEDTDHPDWTPKELAEHYAAAVNNVAGPEQAHLPLIHKLPTAT